jgi:hypothetical protein
MDRAGVRAGPEDVGDQTLIRGLGTAFPFVRPGLKRCCSQIVGTRPTGSGSLLDSKEHGANIPPKRNRKAPICFSPYLYRARNLVERFFNKIKQCRRVATRYDKLAAYLAFIKLASI